MNMNTERHSLRVTVPTPRGKTGGRERVPSLPFFFGGWVRLHVGYERHCYISRCLQASDPRTYRKTFMVLMINTTVNSSEAILLYH